MKGNEEIVKRLIDTKGVDVNVATDDGSKPLMTACAGGHEAVVDQLMQAGADANLRSKIGYTTLMAACKKGNEKIVNRLIATKVVDVNVATDDGFTLLMMACAGGHKAVVDQLMQAGADFNAENKEGCTALSIAKNNEIVRKLLAAMESTSKRKRDQDDEGVREAKSAKTHENSEIAISPVEDGDSALATAFKFFPVYSEQELDQNESSTSLRPN